MARREDQIKVGSQTYIMVSEPDSTDLVFPVDSLISVISITRWVPQGDGAQFAADVFEQFNRTNSYLLQSRKHVQFQAQTLIATTEEEQAALDEASDEELEDFFAQLLNDMLVNGELAGSSVVCQHLFVEGRSLKLYSFFRGLSRKTIIHTARPFSLTT